MNNPFSTKTQDLYTSKGIFGKIFNIERKKRIIFVLKRIKGTTVLEIGAYDGILSKILNKKGFKSLPIDLEPKDPMVKKGDVLKLDFKDKSFDTTIAMNILEHVADPVKALNEIKRVTKKQIFICVPNEPYFTLFRFVGFKGWCDEHLTALAPKFFKIHLGNPVAEKKFMLKREYIGEWNLKDKF